MAKRSLLFYSLGLALLSFFGSQSAFAHESDCANILKCGTHRQEYILASHACLAEAKSLQCGAYKSDKEFSRYVKNCSPEAICEERRIERLAQGVIPGCTGITKEKMKAAAHDVATCAESWQCWKQVPRETLMVIGRTTIAVVSGLVNHVVTQVSTVYNMMTDTKTVSADTKRGAAEYTRRFNCFNNEYKFRTTCEIYQGTFNAITLGAFAKAPAALLREAPGAARRTSLATRESVVAAKTAAGQGVRPSQFQQIRKRARDGVGVTSIAASGARAETVQSELGGSKKAGIRSGAPTSTRTLGTSPEQAQANYLKRYLDRQNTSVEQRRAYEAVAYDTKPRPGIMFVDIQNSAMKCLNDTLCDKNLVTAMTNHRLQITVERLKGLSDRYPTLEPIVYDDFKSARFAFKFKDGKIPDGFKKEVTDILNGAEADFVADINRRGFVPKDAPLKPAGDWFSSGIGSTADEANAAARNTARVREQTGTSIVDASKPLIRKNFEARLQQTEVYRRGLTVSLRNTPLMERLPNGDFGFKKEVYEAFAKAKTPNELAEAVRERTGHQISAGTATQIRTYMKSVDEWSTGLLLVESREAVTFTGSKFNGLTIDVCGMGALNRCELANSLAGVQRIDQALPNARKAERAATLQFESNKAAIVQAAESSLKSRGIEADVKVSGDDIIIMPTNKALTPEALEGIHDAVAKSSSTSNVRISAVEAGAKKADNIAVKGELIEKKVRGLTVSTVQDQSRYTLMVVSDSAGNPKLKVAARSGSVSPEALRAFEEAFQKSLEP